ncbi:hypothetical protein S40288_11357 [Stachybotrys chartarum IBT 40288]|nr:hypothetical protein S40288_11357 [Stachybotrys chartarum IBT 40288]
MGLPLFVAPTNSTAGKSKPEDRPTVDSFRRVIEALDKEHEYQRQPPPLPLLPLALPRSNRGVFADNTHVILNTPAYADLDRVLRGTGLRAFRAKERLLHEVRREAEEEDDDVLEVVW